MNESNLENLKTEPIFEWSTKDFLQHKRNYYWYLVVLTLAIVLSIVFYYQKMYSAVVLVVVALIYIFATSRIPEKVSYKIYNEGVQIGKKVFSFQDFKQFGIVLSDPVKIYLSKAGIISTLVNLNVSADIFDDVFKFISSKLPQGQDHKEDLVDTINRIIKL